MEEKQSRSSEEIDLLYFLRPVTNGMKKIARAGENYVQLLFNNKIIFFLILFIITASAYSLRFIIPPAFQTDGIFVSHTLSGKYCGMMIQSLNELTGGEDIPVLAGQLKVSPVVAAEIQSIKLLPLADTSALGKRDTVPSFFRVSLVIGQMENIDSIQRGIMSYLESSEYAKKRKEARIRTLEAIRENLLIKTKSLDSVKEIVNSSIIPRSKGQGIILGEPINPVTIYQAEMAYYQDRLRVDESLATIDNIEVIQPFLKKIRPNYPDYNKFVIKGFLVALVIALILTPVIGKKKPKAR